ncbi:hypothetical protein COV82_00060 [Candidatus Peregrinibacteria bacterium CG11_big_fil_rev_8_21_14_0_20_46_8]|nr:MAG: hypothetical protein COV82_00060 [Candidatus Peregrinibacteria bacterium CG11_big_fil_rev_8_21_14_0_20_46_8]
MKRSKLALLGGTALLAAAVAGKKFACSEAASPAPSSTSITKHDPTWHTIKPETITSTAKEASVPQIRTSSRTEALHKLQSACDDFFNAPEGEAGAIFDAYTEIGNALNKLTTATSTASGDKVPTNLEDACQLNSSLIKRILGTGAQRDIRMAPKVIDFIDQGCRGPEQDFIDQKHAEIDIQKERALADCRDLPLETPEATEDCKRDAILTWGECAKAVCGDDSDFKKFFDCTRQSPAMKPCDDTKKAEKKACSEKFGESRSDCQLNASTDASKQRLVVFDEADEYFNACRKTAARDEYSGIDFSELVEKSAQYKANIIVSTALGVEGGHIPSPEELDEYIMLIKEIVLNQDELLGPLAQKLGADKEAVRKRYVNDFADKLEALAKKDEKDPRMQSIIRRMSILRRLADIFAR